MKIERRVGSTVELASYGMTQVWLGEGRRLQIYHTKTVHPIHSHTYRLESRVLWGRLIEHVYDFVGNNLVEVGKIMHSEIDEETYEVAPIHQIELLDPLVVTLVTEIKQTGWQGRTYDHSEGKQD